MKNHFAHLVEIVAFLSIAVVMVGFLGKWHFALDLASHFRLQAIIALLLACPLLFFLKHNRRAAVSLVFACGFAASTWPYFQPNSSTAMSAEYRLLSLNVLGKNSHHGKLIQSILDSDPDIVILQETNSGWIDSLDAALGERWRYRKVAPRSDNFGIAMYSKLPWSNCEVVEYESQLPIPSISANFELANGRRLRVIGSHPLPPMSSESWAARNATFEAIARDVRSASPERTIVAGDLNCTPWSYWFGRLLSESQLRDSAAGQGIRSTWQPYPIPLTGLPIDHVLVGSDITVFNRHVGPNVGSDHRAVIIDFK